MPCGGTSWVRVGQKRLITPADRAAPALDYAAHPERAGGPSTARGRPLGLHLAAAGFRRPRQYPQQHFAASSVGELSGFRCFALESVFALVCYLYQYLSVGIPVAGWRTTIILLLLLFFDVCPSFSPWASWESTLSRILREVQGNPQSIIRKNLPLIGPQERLPSMNRQQQTLMILGGGGWQTYMVVQAKHQSI